jgi:hypothetical protein
VETVKGVGYRMSIGNLPAGQTATSTPPTRHHRQMTVVVMVLLNIS